VVGALVGSAGAGPVRWASADLRKAASRPVRLAVDGAPAGSRLHGAGEEGVPFRDIAEVIGRQLKLRVVSVAAEDAGQHFGFLSAMVPFDNPTSSALTRERLGWRPEGPALIADIEKGHCFND
jgi:nucleoside-diphosphate-sugar epimerase